MARSQVNLGSVIEEVRSYGKHKIDKADRRSSPTRLIGRLGRSSFRDWNERTRPSACILTQQHLTTKPNRCIQLICYSGSGTKPTVAIMVDLAKRTRPDNDDDVESPAQKRVLLDSAAAKFNVAAMRKLQRALEADPEVDLANALPLMYSSRLASRKTNKGNE